MDGTLFKSPLRPKWWPQGKTWWAHPSSLDQPCVPEKPDSSWWNESVVSEAKQSISNPNVYAVLCTGRPDGTGGFRWRVPELLQGKGLHFDKVILNPGGPNTDTYKAAVLKKLLIQHPKVTGVHVWDDKEKNLLAMKRVTDAIEMPFTVHLISEVNHEVDCSPETIQKIIARWEKRIDNRKTSRYIKNMK
jgi:hypothetical protein